MKLFVCYNKSMVLVFQVLHYNYCLCDFSGHVGRHINGSDGVHGGYGIFQMNLERKILSEF